MKRRLTFRRTIVSICCLVGLGIASLGAQCTGGDAPDPFDPTVPTGNRPPSLIITGVTTPGEAYSAEQGDPVTISFTGSDGEDVAVIRVFASTSNNPTPAEEILISDGFSVGPGTGSGSSVWDTSSIELGSYQIFAEIDDRTYDSNTGLGNPAVRVAAPQPLLIEPVGTGPENGAPTLVVELPLADAGVTNKDVLTIRFDIKDPNSDEDDIALTYYLDKDRNAANDDVDPPLEVGSTTLSAGFAEIDTFLEWQDEIDIDLNVMPIRLQTDEGGRPLPYYVRIKADDGNGGVVNAYASGAVRIVSAASDVVDLLTVGSTVAGATFQGFYGEPEGELRGSRAGSSFAAMGDIDSDGQDDFAIGAQTASPFNYDTFATVGEAYIIYGRQRTPDPDLMATGFAQGRLSGVIGLSSVGTFKPFPATDDRYQTIFNVRGNVIPAAGTSGYGSLGISSLAKMPNITGVYDTIEPPDDTPELLVGLAYTGGMTDGEDLDPVDACTFGNDDVYPPYQCLGGIVSHVGDDAIEATVELPAEGRVAEDTWAPGPPPDADNDPLTHNVDLGLTTERILEISNITITVSGVRADSEDISFTMDVRLEAAEGPLLEDISIPIPATLPDEEPTGEFEDVTFDFNAVDPAFPLAKGDLIPASVYDGVFNIYLRPSAGVEFSDVTVTVDCVTAEPVEHELRLVYFDTFPSPYSTDANGCPNDANSAYADPLVLQDLPPACPPNNRSLAPYLEPGSSYPDGWLCSDVPTDVFYGLGFQTPDGVSPNREGYQSGYVVVAACDNTVLRRDPVTGRYLGGFQGTNQAERTVRIVPFLWRFGQPEYLWRGGEGLRGARFRGAWYNPGSSNGGFITTANSDFPLYDPMSLFGHTVDSMPELSTYGHQNIGAEMIMSAPGQGVSTSLMGRAYFVELPDLAGLYDSANPDPRMADFDFGTRFSIVASANLIVSGAAVNVGRIRFYFGSVDTDDGPVDITPRDVLLYPGARPYQEASEGAPQIEFYDVFDYSFLEFGVDALYRIPLTRAQLELLQNGSGTIYAKRLDDCTSKESAVQLDSVILEIENALVYNVGAFYIVDGWDWTRNLEATFGCYPNTDGDAASDDDRPMSWPSAGSTVVNEAPQRGFCYPTVVSDFYGEAPFDAFGWAHSTGDVGGGPNGPDGNPDIVCGAPLSDNDPLVPDLINCPPDEDAPLTDNGKVFLIYGTATLADSDMPCNVERFEIRGTHDDDQFGRCQGAAGDMNGDTRSDFFFAAEGYDADGTGGVPSTGEDAGLVGVVFASSAITGERTIRAEQVGTANFLGCKFVGGSAGARLGGGDGSRHVLENLLAYWDAAFGMLLGPHPLAAFETEKIVSKGQYGVSSAGDFNIDGFDDLLITAPGQTWPGATIRFNGAVADGYTVRINSITFEFDTNGVVSSGRVAVSLSDTSAEAAQKALMAAMSTYSAETIGISSVRSQSDFPAPLEDIPTITFIARRADSLTVTSSGASVAIETFTRQGVAYLVFGSNQLLENNTFVLPDDLNRRVNGKRILKGVVFVSAYEKDTGPSDESPDEAPVEVVSSVGDIDGDGFVDIILGAPQADFINILAPDQRRQASGDAYVIYGNGFGLNSASQN